MATLKPVLELSVRGTQENKWSEEINLSCSPAIMRARKSFPRSIHRTVNNVVGCEYCIFWRRHIFEGFGNRVSWMLVVRSVHTFVGGHVDVVWDLKME